MKHIEVGDDINGSLTLVDVIIVWDEFGGCAQEILSGIVFCHICHFLDGVFMMCLHCDYLKFRMYLIPHSLLDWFMCSMLVWTIVWSVFHSPYFISLFLHVLQTNYICILETNYSLR